MRKYFDIAQESSIAFIKSAMKRFKETLYTNQTVDGLTTNKTAGETFAFGEIGYLNSDGKVYKANATNASKYPAVVMACGSITANNEGKFLLMGTARNDSWNFTAGGFIYLGTSDGAITQNGASLTVTNYATQILGFAHPNADTVMFLPQLTYVVYA
jgi:hypothetical protein